MTHREGTGSAQAGVPPTTDGRAPALAPDTHPDGDGALVRTWGLLRWTLGCVFNIAPRLTTGLIAVSIVEGLMPLFLFLAIRGVIDAQAVGTAEGASSAPLRWWLCALFLAAVGEALVTQTGKLLRARLLAEADRDLTAAVLNTAATLPVDVLEEHRSQDTLDRLRSRVAARLVELISRVAHILAAGIQIVTLATALMRVEPLVALFAPPCFLPFLRYDLSLGRRRFGGQRQPSESRRLVNYYVDLLTSARQAAEVRLLGIAPHLIGRFRTVMDATARDDARRQWQAFQGAVVFSIISLVVFVALLARVASRGAGDPHAIGNVAFFAAASLRLRGALERVVNSTSDAMEQLGHAAAVQTFLARVPDRPAPSLAPVPSPFRPDLRCEHVSFRYPGTSIDVLQDVSLDIAAGETVAIVGENGSGKSTLVKLLAGFYQPTAGRILLSGCDMRELAPESVHRHIAFFFQDGARYAASVSDNVAYGNWPRLRDDRASVERLAARAGVTSHVQRMPQGYDTVLGRQFGDYEPSGGVWQRIALARVLARDAALLILDEPTANVDVRAEYELFSQFTTLAAGRTTILISHRFSTVSMANRILVLADGRIVEQGTHDALLAANGRYAKLYAYHQRRVSGA